MSDYLYSFPPYPTPSRDLVNVLIYFDSKTEFDNGNISIVDIHGNEVAQKKDLTIDKLTNYSAVLSWNCTGIADGIYIILITHGNRKQAIKIMVSK